jgi:hypothetical protein
MGILIHADVNLLGCCTMPSGRSSCIVSCLMNVLPLQNVFQEHSHGCRYIELDKFHCECDGNDNGSLMITVGIYFMI